MTFLGVGWLALLVPWAWLTLRLWRRDQQPHPATATFLWDARATPPTSASRSFRRPPWAIVCLLAAMLAAIVALARPALHGRLPQVIVIVDRAVALMATIDGKSLRERFISDCENELARARPHELTICVGETDVGDWSAARRAAFTAKPTRPSLERATADALRRADAVVVLTAQSLDARDQRIVLLAAPAVANAGIVHAAAMQRQVMVRVANDGQSRSAELSIASAGVTTSRMISLPTTGQQADVFIGLPAMDDRVDVRLSANDALAIDDEVVLLRGRDWPRLALEGDVPEAAARFAAAYTRERPGEGAVITLGTDANATKGRAIVFGRGTRREAGATTIVAEHEILRDVKLAALRPLDADPPPGEWTTIVAAGDRPVIAVRDAPARQAWLGFDVEAIAEDASFVVLLSNAIEWIAGGDGGHPQWLARTPAEVGADWERLSGARTIEAGPGLYRDGAGRAVSVHVPAVRFELRNGQGDLADRIARSERDGLRPLTRPLALAAAILTTAGACLIGLRVYLDSRHGTP